MVNLFLTVFLICLAYIALKIFPKKEIVPFVGKISFTVTFDEKFLSLEEFDDYLNKAISSWEADKNVIQLENVEIIGGISLFSENSLGLKILRETIRPREGCTRVVIGDILSLTRDKITIDSSDARNRIITIDDVTFSKSPMIYFPYETYCDFKLGLNSEEDYDVLVPKLLKEWSETKTVTFPPREEDKPMSTEVVYKHTQKINRYLMWPQPPAGHKIILENILLLTKDNFAWLTTRKISLYGTAWADKPKISFVR